jgi:hypothetical protein
MNKQNNEIKKDAVIFEVSFKVTTKSYRLSFATRKAWLIFILLFILRILKYMTG